MKSFGALGLCIASTLLVATPPSSIAQDKSKNLVKPVEKLVSIPAVAFSPDGRLLAAARGGDKGGFAIWDATSLKLLTVVELDGGVPCLAFSPDSKALAVGRATEHCHIYSCADAKLLRTLPGHGESAKVVKFGSVGNILAVASGSDGSIRLWNHQTGESLNKLDGHKKGVLDLAFAPNGKLLASSGDDSTIVYWDCDSGKRIGPKEKPNFGHARRIAIDSTGQWLTGTSNSGSVRIVTLEGGKVLADFNDGGGSDWLALAPSGKILAVGRTGAKYVQLQFPDIRLATAEEEKRIKALIAQWEDERYDTRVTASQELQKLGLIAEALLLKALKESPSAETRLRARDALNVIRSPKSPVVLHGHIESIQGAAFTPDSKTLATGAQDGFVILWDMETFQIKRKLQWPDKGP